MTRFAATSLLSSFALALLLAAPLPSAFGEPSEWYTDAAESTDGRYLFVSLSNRPLDVELKDEGLTGEERDQIEFFRLHYPVSGMYLNDGTNTPRWKFEKPWPGEPIIAPDGEHVIFQGGGVTNMGEQQVVEFTRRGETIRSYTDRDLIDSWPLKRLLNGNAPAFKTKNYDANSMTYTIVTDQGEEFDFNVKNGDLIAVRSPFPMYYSIFGVALFALVVALRYWLRRRKVK